MTDKILQGESIDIEYKETLPYKGINYMKTVVAFANGVGGQIIIGVEDGTLKVVGVDKETIFATMDNITNAIADSCEPMIVPNIYPKVLESKQVIVIEIASGNQHPYYVKSLGINNGTFIRVAGTTRVAPRYMLKDLILRGENKYYDQLPNYQERLSEAEVQDICKDMTTYALNNCKSDEERKNLKPLTPNKLEEWKLLHKINGELVPSNGLCLLMGKALPDMEALIQCAVFRGETRALFVNRKDYTGKLYEQLDNAYDFVIQAINVGARFEGIQRVDVYEIPLGVIREVICNAVCHRNYLQDQNIQVALYDNRLEVTSPGSIVEGNSIERIKSGVSKVRNRGIALAFAYMKIIEKWGSGMQRIFGECHEYGLPQPKITADELDVRVEIFRPDEIVARLMGKPADKVGDTTQTTQSATQTTQSATQTTQYKNVLLANEMAVVNLLRQYANLSQKAMAEKLGFNLNTLKYYVNKLKEQKIVEYQGVGKNGKWVVNEERVPYGK